MSRERESSETLLARRLERYASAIRLVDEGEAPILTQRAVELLRQGMKPIDMPSRLGVSRSRTYQALTDPLDVQGRVRRHKRHGTCLNCGRPTYNGGSIEVPLRCRDCAPIAATKWTRERLIECAQEYVRRYGNPPGAMDWNVAMALEKAHPERQREILQRDAEYEWPTATTVQYHFGSWNAMLKAAGLETLTPGKRRDVARWRGNLKGRNTMKTIEEMLQDRSATTKARIAELEQKLDEAKQELAKVELLLDTAASSNGAE